MSSWGFSASIWFSVGVCMGPWTSDANRTFSSACSMVSISSHPSSVFSGPWKTGSENLSDVSANW